jgi:hypothetical protein
MRRCCLRCCAACARSRVQLPNGFRPLVYEAAFVVPAGQAQLEGVSVEACNESDKVDTDFFGAVKVRGARAWVAQPRQSRHGVPLACTHLDKPAPAHAPTRCTRWRCPHPTLPLVLLRMPAARAGGA